MSDRDGLPPGYPHEWEADVLLGDGGTARLRPITPADADLLVDFYARVSDESKYLRFFAPYPRLTQRDIELFTNVDYVDRVALILTVQDEMIAVGRFDRLGHLDGHQRDQAEVAFLVEDAHQGRGVAQLLLEHLADAARERGITGFVAEVLPENQRMAQVFADAGYKVSKAYEDGVLQVEFPILPTDTAVGVMERREHRAEASSMQRLLNPERVVVLGQGARVQDIVTSLLAGGFRGQVTAVGLDDVPVSGVRTAGSLAELEPGIDLVVAALPQSDTGLIPQADLGAVVIDAAHKGAHGMVVLTGSGSRAGTGDLIGGDGAQLVSLVRAYGLRALGPDALGLINTDPAVALNASPGPMPRAGGVAMFCQAPAVGVAMLAGALRHDLGLSSFVSTGAYADVTANDVMQFWEDDERTRVCLLSLDRIGNPRKFSRIVRRLTRRKPVVVYAPGQAERSTHAGARGGLQWASAPAVDAIFRQSGVIVVHRRDSMFDIAQVLARQPLPAGPRVKVVTNSRSLARQMQRTVDGVGLLGAGQVVLPPGGEVSDLARATVQALADPDCDSVVTAVVNPFGAITDDVHDSLERIAQTATKPLLGVFIEFSGPRADRESSEPDEVGGLPTFRGQGDALQALAAVSAYAHWRERDAGAVPMIEVEPAVARAVVSDVLAEAPGGRSLTPSEASTVLRAFGIHLVPAYRVRTLEEAVGRAEELGWNVVLKATAERVRNRPDLAGVFRYLDDADELRQGWDHLAAVMRTLDGSEADASASDPVVQAMMPSGVALEVESREDPAFGPVVSLGVDGIASQLLGDVVHRVPPLTDVDAAAMVRDLRTAPLLFGWHGGPRVDVASVENLLQRVAQLANAVPQLAVARLSPCIATTDGVRVVGANIQIAPTEAQRDPMARMLS